MKKTTNNRNIVELSPGVFRALPDTARRLAAWLSPNPADTTNGLLTIPAAASGPILTNFVQPNFNAASPSYIVADQLIFEQSSNGTATNNSTVKLTDANFNTDLMANPLHMRAVFGTAQLPGILHEPLVLVANSGLRAIIKQLSGGSVTMRPYVAGVELFGDDRVIISRLLERKRYVQPFFMMPDDTATITLDANGEEKFISQNGRGHFQALSLVGISTGEFGVEIIEGRTRRSISNGLIWKTAGIGTAQYPYEFRCPFLIPRGNDISWRIVDKSGSENTVHIALQGKMYDCPIREIPEVERELFMPYDLLRI